MSRSPVRELAFTDKVGPVNLSAPEPTGLTNKNSTGPGGITVAATTLDDDLDDDFKCRLSFLKIDVEGKAYDALLGMEQLFRNNYVLLQIEIAGGESEAVRDLLMRYGMEFTESIGGDFYFSPRKT